MRHRNSRALIIRTPTKGTPNLHKQSYGLLQAGEGIFKGSGGSLDSNFGLLLPGRILRFPGPVYKS